MAAEDFAKTAGASKFSKMKGKDLARMAAAEKGDDEVVDPRTGTKTKVAYDYSYLQNSVAARREMFRYVMTDKKAVAGLKVDPAAGIDQIKAGIDVFGGHTTAEGKAFMKEIAKVSPDFVADYNLSDTDLKEEANEGFKTAYSKLPTGATDAEKDFQLRTHAFKGSLKSGDIKETVGINSRVWETPEFHEALQNHISQLRDSQTRKQYLNRLERALIDSPGGDKKIEILRNGAPAKPGDPNATPPIPPTPAGPPILGPNHLSAPTRPPMPPPTPTGPLGP